MGRKNSSNYVNKDSTVRQTDRRFSYKETLLTKTNYISVHSDKGKQFVSRSTACIKLHDFDRNRQWRHDKGGSYCNLLKQARNIDSFLFNGEWSDSWKNKAVEQVDYDSWVGFIQSIKIIQPQRARSNLSASSVAECSFQADSVKLFFFKWRFVRIFNDFLLGFLQFALFLLFLLFSLLQLFLSFLKLIIWFCQRRLLVKCYYPEKEQLPGFVRTA